MKNENETSIIFIIMLVLIPVQLNLKQVLQIVAIPEKDLIKVYYHQKVVMLLVQAELDLNLRIGK